MTEIVITGITGFQNRGVEALLVPVLRGITSRFKDARVTVLTRTPQFDIEQIDVSLKQRVRFISSSLWKPSGRLYRWKSQLKKLLSDSAADEPRTEAAEVLKRASLVIAMGGDVFSSDYNNLSTHLKPLELAQRYRVPVVFLGHSIGPFLTQEEADAWLAVARQAPLITVRESISYRYLTEDLGLTERRVHLTADPAFILPPLQQDKAMRLLHACGIHPERPILALGMSQGISRFADISPDEHTEAWLRLIQVCIDSWDVDVLLVPHVQDSLSNNDRLLATALCRELDYDPRIHLIGGEHTAAELKGVIGACDMMIAERMHAAIAGLSSGVCTSVVGYSVKAEGIMRDLFGTVAETQGFLMSTEAFLNTEVAYEKASTAWQHRQEIRAQLLQDLPEVKRRARANIDLLAPLLTL
jgi:colanic acid/amylovoran biosynthesis protein